MKVPEDEELRNIIDKLANFVARNGPKFEELTKSKQRDNPKFSFLFGGDNHEYYKWKVSIEGTQVEAQKLASNNIVLTPAQPPEEEERKSTIDFDITEFKDLLQKLIQACTKDNIQNGKNWIVNEARTDKQLKKVFQYLLRRMLEENLPFQQKLHIIYLANDLLHHSRKKNLPQLQDNLEEYILPILAMAYQDAAADNQAKLAKVVKIWDTQAFFKEPIREELKKGDELYDLQRETLKAARDEMESEKVAIPEQKQQHSESDDRARDDELTRQQRNANIYQQPPSHATQGQYQQYDNQFNQWTTNQQRPPQPVSDPFHYYKPDHFPPNTHQPPPFGQFQQGFPPQGGHPDQGPMSGQPGFEQFNPRFGVPPPQVQTFDYSHGMDQGPGGGGAPGGGGGPAPMTFDYEHGKAPVHGAPVQEDVRDPTIPMAPYYDLPAGLMVPLVKLWDCEYKPVDPKDLRLPIPQPPSERLLAALEAFYALPSHDRPRDSQGWEKNGLFEFYKAKVKYIKDKEKELVVIERTPSPPPTPTPEDYDSEGDRLVTDAPGGSPSCSLGRRRSRSSSRDRGRKRSYSRSRSRSTSKSPRYRRRSQSNSKSRSRSRSGSPVHRSPVRRSPTPPEGFVGFETKTIDSRIEESNVGHQLLKKMGWGGQGLGKNEHGVLDPIKQGEVREKQDKFKGVGVELNDPFESYRKSKSYTYGRPRERR